MAPSGDSVMKAAHLVSQGLDPDILSDVLRCALSLAYAANYDQ